MTMQNTLHDATTQFEQVVKEDSMLSLLSARVIKLLTEVMTSIKEQPNNKEQLYVLSDDKVFAELALLLTQNRAIHSSRELRKHLNRINAKQEFLNFIKDNGGALKAGDVAKLLDCSRQTVNNQRKAGKLIAIPTANDFIYPGFQFLNGSKLKNLDIILNELKGVSTTRICSFILGEFDYSDLKSSPYEILAKGASSDELKLLIREATLIRNDIPN